MTLVSCPRCERHILVESASCRFCGTRLGTTSGFNRAMMLVALGMALASCNNDDSAADLGGADYTGPGPMTTTETTSTGEPPTSTSSGTASSSSSGTAGTAGTADSTATSTGATTSGSSSDGGGADYTGPGPGTTGTTG